MKKILMIMVLILMSSSVSAATVSHSASEVQPGSFATGDFYFDGNVGIGTTEPALPLDISVSSSGGIRFLGGNAGSFQLLNPSNNLIKLGASGGGDELALMTDAKTEQVRIDSNGNVGIGTTTPTSELSFGGSDPAITQSTADGSDNAQLSLSGGGTAGASFGGHINLYGNEHSKGGSLEIKAGKGSGGNVGNISLWTGNTNTERMIITNEGNVGIGTTEPDTKLHIESNDINARELIVEGTAADSAVGLRLINDARRWDIYNDGTDNDIFLIRDVTAGGDRFALDSSGNVGIGTTSPGAKLEVFNPSGSGVNAVNIDNDNGWGLVIQGDSTSGGIYLGPNADDDCYDQGGATVCDIRTDYAEMMYFSEEVDNGDVVVIDTENEGHFKLSTKPYDKMVAGVVSLDPAMVLSVEGTYISGYEEEENGKPMAVAGRKRIKVTDENGEIKPGDLLVTSSERGKAMRCEIKEIPESATNDRAVTIMRNNELCRNTAVAKAMTSKGEDGKVLALITLQ